MAQCVDMSPGLCPQDIGPWVKLLSRTLGLFGAQGGHPHWAELNVCVTTDMLSQLKMNFCPSGVDLGDGGKEKCRLH